MSSYSLFDIQEGKWRDDLASPIRFPGFSYAKFCLEKDNFYFEVFHADFHNLFKMDGAVHWPSVQKVGTSNYKMSLVCYNPNGKKTKHKQAQHACMEKAQMGICKMLHDCFPEESNAINDCINNCAALAIFLHKTHMEDSTQLNPMMARRRKTKSIFNLGGDVVCLSATVYFCSGHHTQVLWLATTLDEPPVGSQHITWCKKGLASFLLCLLIKQHSVGG